MVSDAIAYLMQRFEVSGDVKLIESLTGKNLKQGPLSQRFCIVLEEKSLPELQSKAQCRRRLETAANPLASAMLTQAATITSTAAPIFDMS